MSQFIRCVKSDGIRFRWFTCNCTEIVLPSGKHIVIDPFLPAMDDPRSGNGKDGMSCGYTVDDIEGADYVIINHTHFDHIQQLEELYNKFHPRIICHNAFAIVLSQHFEIPERDFFPFESLDFYDFGDFILETNEGRHNFIPLPTIIATDHASEDYLMSFGGMYNTNFLIRLPDGEKIGFTAGDWNTLTRNRWRNLRPNILFRHRLSWKIDPVELAHIIADTGCQIAIPWHHNNAYDPSYPYDMNDFTQRVDMALTEITCNTRFINPERGKWYELILTVNNYN